MQHPLTQSPIGHHGEATLGQSVFVQASMEDQGSETRYAILRFVLDRVSICLLCQYVSVFRCL